MNEDWKGCERTVRATMKQRRSARYPKEGSKLVVRKKGEKVGQCSLLRGWKWTVGVGSGGSGHLCTWLEVKSVTGWTTGIGHRISRGGGLRSIGRRGVLPLTPVKVAGCSTVINHST
ncbi:uncharacterized protein LOC117602322 isoform X1 [Osmia lignaria lignaria]|uniref:uncharacterized protein LOC117602322 isoform X1 n=1 Tax=Osmia lignaria lignaria TaxID=1437193 RepID=UPI00147865A0|nr:uncharacterized protein LOC117602322 isoform X1 [Osmia lignaria]